ncbi:transcription termination factor MTEF1, chloroplastic-like [Aristolochia californica]|uniref:transcription termination factor MTEF1, chloroplastic-like n=1 Tax=Aristolochia californica TaxID=171875 RepID=UPI0035DF4D32
MRILDHSDEGIEREEPIEDIGDDAEFEEDQEEGKVSSAFPFIHHPTQNMTGFGKLSPPPPSESVNRLVYVVNFLKTKGLSETHFPHLSFLCPGIFHSDTDGIESVFTFSSQELGASPEESCGLIYRCPKILLNNVELCLWPTLHFLLSLGVKKLNSANTLNAHLINTHVEKLEEKIWFLESLGFTEQESTTVCARLPAIFGYSVENNLTPKLEYLVMEMEWTLEELKAFLQYFAFSLTKQIVSRHMHLKERGVKVQLDRMLVWSDQRFYTKW